MLDNELRYTVPINWHCFTYHWTFHSILALSNQFIPLTVWTCLTCPWFIATWHFIFMWKLYLIWFLILNWNVMLTSWCIILVVVNLQHQIFINIFFTMIDFTVQNLKCGTNFLHIHPWFFASATFMWKFYLIYLIDFSFTTSVKYRWYRY